MAAQIHAKYSPVHAQSMYPVLSARTQRLLRAISLHLQPNLDLLPQEKKTPSFPEGRLSFCSDFPPLASSPHSESPSPLCSPSITPVISGCVFFGRLPVFTP